MNTITHPVAPEEIMALLDGELSNTEASAVSTHMEDCAECANLAAQFRSTSLSLSSWAVPPVSSLLENSITELAQQESSGQSKPKQRLFVRPSFWTWKQWTLGGGCAAILLLTVILSAIPTTVSYKLAAKPRMMDDISPEPASQPIDGKPVTEQKSVPVESRASQMDSVSTNASSDTENYYNYNSPAGPQPAPPPPPPATKAQNGLLAKAVSSPAPAPMIARTVSLTILVKNFAAARASLDTILVQHQGYSAQLTVSTPENAPRSFQASLRIPAPELAATLSALRSLGRVQNESQSGEEVTQQHADLVARLQNSRETEERLRAILQQRTGKIEDVLQVEEEIARVRGEIESMESDQKVLEHRVDFASVDLQLTEEYKAQFNAPDASASTRMQNAFVTGLTNASATLLGIVLFFEEYGPVICIWLAILGLPTLLVWRRYRRINGRV